MLNRSDCKIFMGSFVGLTVIFFALLVWKYLLFGFYDWDLAFFTQAHTQLLKGNGFVSLVGIPYLGDHTYFFSYLILPFVALWQNPLMLLLLKASVFALSGCLFYVLCSFSLSRGIAFILTACYLLFPANLFALLYEFNPECFASSLIVGMFLALRQCRLGWFVILSLLLVLIKENMALVVLCWSVVLWVKASHFDRRIYALLILFMGLYFYWSVFVFLPQARHIDVHAFIVRYGSWGNSLPTVAANLTAHPSLILDKLFQAQNISYAQELLWPLLFGGWWSLGQMAGLLPLLAQHMLSFHPPEQTIFFHYASSMTPFIFVAVLCFFERLVGQGQVFLKKFFLVLLILGIIIQNGLMARQYELRLNLKSVAVAERYWALINMIPAQASVIASFEFLAPLSTRSELYAFHKIYHPNYQESASISHSELNVGKAFHLPAAVKYALINFKDPWYLAELSRDPQVVKERVRQFMSAGWRLVAHQGDVVLLNY